MDTKIQTNMSMNEMVLVSPNVTRAGKWLEGRIIDIEDNFFQWRINRATKHMFRMLHNNNGGYIAAIVVMIFSC